MRKFPLTKSKEKVGRNGLKVEKPNRVSKDEASLIRRMKSATESNPRTGLPEKVTVVEAARKADDFNPGDRIPVVVNKQEFEAMKRHFGEPREHPETGVMQFGFGGNDQGRSMANAGGGGARGDSRGGGRGGAMQGPNRDGSTMDVNPSGGRAMQGPNRDGSTMDVNPTGAFNGARMGGAMQGPNLDGSTIDVNPEGIGNFENPDYQKPTTKMETPIPLKALMQFAGMIAPTPFGLGMKIGDYMGDLVGQDQAAVDAGLLESTRMDDSVMGRVDNIKGQGIGSFGNAASDDRAANLNGLGGGMVGGNQSNGLGRPISLGQLPDVNIAAMIKRGEITADNAAALGLPLQRYQQIAKQVMPATPSAATAAADASAQNQPYSPLNITGSSSFQTWPWNNN